MRRIVYLAWVLLISLSGFSQNIELGINTGQNESMYITDYSSDGKLFLTASGTTVSLWDAKTGKLIRNIVNDDGVMGVTFGKDSKTIIVTGQIRSVRIFDTSTGKIIQEYSTQHKFHHSSLLSEDGKYLSVLTDTGLYVLDIVNNISVIDIKTKKLITSVTFDKTSKYVYVASVDSSFKGFEVSSGKKIFEKKFDRTFIFKMNLCSDGTMFAFANGNKTLGVWLADGSKQIQDFSDSRSKTYSIHFINANQHLLTYHADSSFKLWNVKTGALEKSIKVSNLDDYSVSPNNNELMICSDEKWIKFISLPDLIVRDSMQTSIVSHYRTCYYTANASKIFLYNDKEACIIERQLKKIIAEVKESKVNIGRAKFGNDKESIILIDNNESYTLWNIEKGGRKDSKPFAPGMDLFSLYCSPKEFNGKYILQPAGSRIGAMDINADLENFEEPTLIYEGHRLSVKSCEFGPDGKTIVSASDDSTVRIWSASEPKLLFTFKEHHAAVEYASYSPNGKEIFSYDQNGKALIWDAISGKIIRSFKGDFSNVQYATYSHSGNMIGTQCSDKTVRIWNTSTGETISTLPFEKILDVQIEFSSNDKWMVTTSKFDIGAVWDVSTGKMITELKGHKSVINDIHFSPDSKYVITTSWDKTSKLWDPVTGKEILTFLNLEGNDWLVWHPSGLFDASAGAMEKLYWIQGNDIVDFVQLKDRFYEPGLWIKALKGEHLREVKGFNEKIPLYPDIKLSPIDSKGDLKIELANKGGGIGKVKLYINGKEIADDIRGEKFNPEAVAATLIKNLKDHPFLIKGDTNLIEVKAYNKDNWVLSRPETVTYMDKRSKEEAPPELFVISIGVSDYHGKDIDLKFPSKDATDMCSSIQVGSKRLFGIEKTHGYLLSSTTETKPTKENIKKVFDEVSTKAKSDDVIVVYLSGHGINWGGDEGDWYYLTQEAFSASADAYNDEAIRMKSGVSSKELSEWIKKIPALKQVMIIDACASGRIVEDLVAQRDIPSNTIRSLDRMKDRTGLHIITGCAADAVSFEASRYGQGILTYSLLEGMKGLSLREGKFVDIVTWFQYARERVPILASGIGGIQEPQIISPNGSESFDVGQLNEEDKKLIPLSNIKPMYVRSNFQDEDELDDVLALGDKMDEALNEFSSKGTESTIVFVDVKEFPEAYKLIGRYKRENNQVTLTLKVKQGTEIINTVSITGKDANDVVDQLLKKINDF